MVTVDVGGAVARCAIRKGLAECDSDPLITRTTERAIRFPRLHLKGGMSITLRFYLSCNQLSIISGASPQAPAPSPVSVNGAPV